MRTKNGSQNQLIQSNFTIDIVIVNIRPYFTITYLGIMLLSLCISHISNTEHVQCDIGEKSDSARISNLQNSFLTDLLKMAMLLQRVDKPSSIVIFFTPKVNKPDLCAVNLSWLFIDVRLREVQRRFAVEAQKKCTKTHTHGHLHTQKQ